MTEILTQPEFESIARIAYDRWGLNLTQRKIHLVSNRLAGFVRRSRRWSSIPAYLEYVESSATDEDLLLFFDLLSTNVTSFFRDPQHFEFLEREFYTPLDRRRIGTPGGRIRIWSAACSIGCEPYSIAIHAKEHLKSLPERDFKILGTDLSTSAVEAATQARYAKRMLDAIPEGMRRKHFRRIEGASGDEQFTVSPAVRRLVTIRRMNLLNRIRFKHRFDVIFCRNVMIYFDQPTRTRVLRQLGSCLQPGGILIVGSAESLSGMDVPFTAVQPSIFRRV